MVSSGGFVIVIVRFFIIIYDNIGVVVRYCY